MTALARLALVALALAASACAPAFHTGPLPGEPKNATFASVEGARVRYVDEGQGPAVVLLHGFASSMHTWKRVQPELLKRHRVIALDLKGFGWTDRPEGDYSPAAQAKLVRALLDQRGVRDVAVVGHSWGASVALQFALSNPARVRRMALYAAWVFEEQLPTTFHFSRASGIGEIIFGAFYTEKADEKMAMAFYDRSFVSEEFAEKIELSLQRPGTKAAALAAARDQRFAEVQKTYADIDKPTLLLWGREDRVTPLRFGERLARTLPDAKLVVYPRCGHFPMLEADKASTRELSAFLAKDAAGATAAQPIAPAASEQPGPSQSPAPPASGPSSTPSAPAGKPTAPPTPPKQPAPPKPAPSAPAQKPEGVDDGKDAPSKLSPNPFGDGAPK